ncbi:hypothetical protein C0J52_19115 [Blattella germanica]|nr:hypothetical protein C0J52_19115 [Blattella germanica]
MEGCNPVSEAIFRMSDEYFGYKACFLHPSISCRGNMKKAYFPGGGELGGRRNNTGNYGVIYVQASTSGQREHRQKHTYTASFNGTRGAKDWLFLI